MRVLLASQYYTPEIGATQNRMLAFTEELLAAGHEVVVICEQPNHPQGVFHEGFGTSPVKRERRANLAVHRLWVSASRRKTAARRLLFYGTFAAGAFAAAVLVNRPDVVFVTSPPLPGALTVAAAARMRHIPLVVDIRDLWPAAAEALGELSNRRLLSAFERAERWLYRSAAAVTTTTVPFCRHIDRIAGAAVSTHIPNGALDELVALPAREPPADGRFRIGYFGNLGIAQGLNIVIEAAQALTGEPVEFLVVGGGPLEECLRNDISRHDLRNIHLRPSVPPDQVGSLMLSCDALLVPLRAHSLLSDFIPSKLYDAMAVGRAAIVAATGEAETFVNGHGFGMSIAPEDGQALARVARRLAGDPALTRRLGDTGKALSVEHSRSRHAARLRELLESVA